MIRKRSRFRSCIVVLGLVGLSACTSVRETLPNRTATEQLLLSSAADRAVENLRLGIDAGTKVQVRAYSLESYDEEYVVGTLRDRLLREGAQLVDDPSVAELILEVRAGALSIDKRTELVGIPSIPIPIPLAGTFDTPELALFKRERQEGIAKLAVTSFDRESGALNSSSGPTFGSSTHDRWVVLFLGWTDEDIGRDKVERQQKPTKNKPHNGAD